MFESVKAFIYGIFHSKCINTSDVFTPATAARLNYVSRLDLENRIINSINTPGKQLVLYGYSGSGKTTIISKILKELKFSYVITHCESCSTFEDVLLSAFDSLDEYYIEEKSKSKSSCIDSTLSGQYREIKASINSSKTEVVGNKFKRIIPPQLTTEKLAEFFGKNNIIWIIEDFHKVSESEMIRVADAMKIFVDLANARNNSKIICIGACDTARAIVQKDPNMTHRFDQIYVNMLSENELKKIIENGCRLLNIEMEDSLVNKIVFHSSRVGSLAHQMCLDICYANKVYSTLNKRLRIDDSAFNSAVDSFIKRNSDTFSSIYEAAVKEQLGWYILKTFSVSTRDKLTFEEIKRKVNSKNRNYSDEDIKKHLDLLVGTQYNVLYYNSNSGKYALYSPFWKSYLNIQFEYVERRGKPNKKSKIREIDMDDENALFNLIMCELVKRFDKLQNK